MNIKTIWNATKEGRQYFVQVKADSMNLEMSSDPVSEFAGGGYTIDLPDVLEDDRGTLRDLKKIFGMDELREIIAFTRALKKIKRSDLDGRTEKFYRIYSMELEKITYETVSI